MKNPFPGMNPWLELHWRAAHARLIVYSGDQLQEKLPQGLRAEVEEDVAIDLDAEGDRYRPDVHVSEPWETSTFPNETAASGEAARGVLVMVEPEVQRHLTIVDIGGQVITAIEFSSPTNKESGHGLDSYRVKQRADLTGGVNLVEIDLLRGGAFALAMSPSDVPKKKRAPYHACVFRDTRRIYRELFQMPLRERLPALPIPLRPADREITLDLQPLIDLCSERGGYGPSEYAVELDPPLSAEDALWAAERLREAGVQVARQE